MYMNVAKIQKRVTFNTLKSLLGINESTNCGIVAYPAIQAAPSFSSSSVKVFGGHKLKCLIPCAIDQDPYFRLTRDIAPRLGEDKPALIHCKFVSGLGGPNSKMSSSDPSTAIFVHDTPAEIKTKINKYAVSTGQDTEELHRKLGGDPDNDISYEYLTFFMEDDDKLTKSS
eukprot:TRINITY_DN1463_c0_g1_i1.p1 TRINITY_DN1463_c0_g1~~TRINITY_DN1463_c0_g1_i1.p1  ORF type:complete len:171 (-),score=31.24 TRINITY_DN1463_c0_g1_i1:293-805(-)